MNNAIQHLAHISAKEERMIIGLMSGTSMDGLDLALCKMSGSGTQTEIMLEEFTTLSYPDEIQQILKEVVSVPKCSLEELCIFNTYLGEFTADLILEALDKWEVEPSSIDCIASHGQTIYHAPKSRHKRSGLPNATLQMGDGDHIARQTRIITISDFRQKHTAAGGEGAPMASLIDRMLFDDPDKNRLLLNIGGIANFSYLPAAGSSRSFTTADSGPGNTLLDAASQRMLDQPFDKGGRTARKGEINQDLLEALKDDPYFELDPPKTTGLEHFNWSYAKRARMVSNAEDLSAPDLLATLTQFTIQTITDAVKKIHPESKTLEVLVSGGGVHNTFLMESLQNELGNTAFKSFEEYFFNADAKEAVCFAVLANELLAGEGFPISAIDHTKSKGKINFGKISLPG
ncbi:anhydro-N-acetylmuramic acid kinase [Aliifodinibius salicampi]|uniref:Anhydro-N-acetylmuramic acid kinase n=1 Tax=Fodinibius salicampi TaxID=1920655 RepID=A0ABT3PY31_9BACT|nr:anhydro-N-acetylmuramic acid kinase [Fodinibius salicampi]MCW9712763.1 anhydro-N-acetylmuramic acid kinase [Fodinibius salicampi]